LPNTTHKGRAVTTTTYASPENNEAARRYKSPPIYEAPEPNTPAIFASPARDIAYGQVKPTAEEAAGQRHDENRRQVVLHNLKGEIVGVDYYTEDGKEAQALKQGQNLFQIAGARRSAVLDGVPTNVATAAVAPGAFSSDTQGAGTSPNPRTGQYPPSPQPRNDAEAGAVMPKLQVQGPVSDAYGTSRSQPGMVRTAIGDKRRDQTAVDPRQNDDRYRKGEDWTTYGMTVIKHAREKGLRRN